MQETITLTLDEARRILNALLGAVNLEEEVIESRSERNDTKVDSVAADQAEQWQAFETLCARLGVDPFSAGWPDELERVVLPKRGYHKPSARIAREVAND